MANNEKKENATNGNRNCDDSKKRKAESMRNWAKAKNNNKYLIVLLFVLHVCIIKIEYDFKCFSFFFGNYNAPAQAHLRNCGVCNMRQ